MGKSHETPSYHLNMAVFYVSSNNHSKKWILASVALTDAYSDIILSRQAMQCTPATMVFYKHTAGVFLKRIEEQGVTSPEQIDTRLVRQYLA